VHKKAHRVLGGTKIELILRIANDKLQIEGTPTMRHNNRPLLVTGCSGFLGSHLSDHLSKEGHDVFCVDNFYPGSKRNILDINVLHGTWPLSELVLQHLTPKGFRLCEGLGRNCPFLVPE
jgi:hypothetical protein